MVLVEPRRVIGYSPLRYPGGKSSLTDFLARAIDHNFQADVRYVEPYAGGAGAAVALLLQGRVGSIIINDFDPAIWAIWHSIVNDSQSFLKLIRETPVSLDEWKMQRSIYQAGNAADPLSLGFASFFLNRTNRSGVMNAGAIGGKAQDGNYRIDARYNKPALIHMVQKIAERQSSITVRNEDGLELIREVREDSGTFIYADPPYFEKGSFLYMNSFTSSQHEELAKELNSSASGKWLLTYDNISVIKELYADRRQQVFSLYYSAHRPGIMNELMVFADGLDLEF